MTIKNIARQIIEGSRARGATSKLVRVLLVLAVAISLTGAKKSPYGPHDKAAYTSPVIIDFLRPGLVVTINSASMASDGTVTAVYTLADPSGLMLDAAGVYTPGPITVSYIEGYIPNNAEQYVNYNTTTTTGAAAAQLSEKATGNRMFRECIVSSLDVERSICLAKRQGAAFR